jgi:hypothetical protein
MVVAAVDVENGLNLISLAAIQCLAHRLGLYPTVAESLRAAFGFFEGRHQPTQFSTRNPG